MANPRSSEYDPRTVAPVHGAEDGSGTFEGIMEQVPIIGNFLSSSREEKARLAATNRAYEAMNKYRDSLKTPEFSNLGEGDWNNVQADPQAVAAQKQALSMLMGIAGNKGMTAEDNAMLGRTYQGVEEQARGNRQAVLQQAAQRGQLGSGGMLANALMNEQNASNMGAQSGNDVAMNAQKRALQAIMAGGQLGGQLSEQSFGQGATKANAYDKIRMFNNQLKQMNYGNQKDLQDALYGHTMDFNNVQTGGAKQASQWASANRQVIPKVVKSIFTMGATAGDENSGAAGDGSEDEDGGMGFGNISKMFGGG